MTMDTNPEVLTILADTGKLENSAYMLKQEAEEFTDSDIYVDNTNSIFTGKDITSFTEFQYFTNIKTIPAFCFSGCTKLKEIVLPESVTTIKLNAFQNTGLETIYIPAATINIDLRSFSYCKSLTNIEVDAFNTKYCSEGGSIYVGARPYTLYTVAPGLTEYTMPEETTSVYGDGDVTWSMGSLLKRIVLNEKVQGITGRWFMYGFSNLTEVTGSERSDIKYYNGCIYNSDYSKLIYWPSGKNYLESDLKYSESGECLVKEFGERSFSQNKLLGDFVIPASVVKLGEWTFYSTSMTSMVVHENITEIGNYCFSWNSKLVSIDINTQYLTGTNIVTTCSKLTSVELSDGTTSIPDAMFSSCTSLQTIDLPETVTKLGASAFMNSGLTSLELPTGLTNIGQSCFMGCVKLGNLDCLSISAPTLGTEAFGNSTSNYLGSKAETKTIHVPSNATGYESGDWQTVLQDIVGFTLYKDL